MKISKLHLHSYERTRAHFYITQAGKLRLKFRQTVLWQIMSGAILAFLISLYPTHVSPATIGHYKIAAIEEKPIPPIVQYLNNIVPDHAEAIDQSISNASKKFKLDKTLLLAVMKVESNFDQYAMSHKGAMCLMQIMPNWHAELLKEKFKQFDNRSIYDIEVCIHSGASILASYVREQGGSIERGLLQYNGSLADETRTYAVKVLSEKKRLEKLLS